MKSIPCKRNGVALRSAIAATALMAASGVAKAEPVSLSLEFTCPFPVIGDQAITADISGDLPTEVAAGDSLPEVEITAITTVPEQAKMGLNVVEAVSVEGTAQSFANIATASGDVPVIVEMIIPFTEIPVDEPGPFQVPASGMQPAVAFGENDIGEAVVTVDDLIMNMISRKADGEIANMPVGEFTSDCTLNPGQNNVLHTFEITGEPPAEQEIAVSPEAIDFGTVPAGVSQEQVVTVTNEGGLPLGINGVSIDGADAAAFMQTSDCTVVEPGSSCAVTVTYFPEGDASHSANLTILSDDADEQETVVPLSGASEVEATPRITVPDEVSFGRVQLSDQVVRTVEIGNTGNASLTINGLEVTGNNSDFVLTGNDCSAVSPDESCTAEVTFTANQEGTQVATLQVVSDDPDTEVAEVRLVAEVLGDDPGVELLMELAGSTYIAGTDSSLPLNGTIDAVMDLASGTFTADLDLEPTQGTFQIVQFLKKLKAKAKVEFEQIGETTGTLQNSTLTANSSMYIRIPKVTVPLIFGIELPIGGGAECRTMDPVNITLASPEGEFNPLAGGPVSGTYDLPPLQNCGALTDVLNHFMAGPGNTIDVDLTAVIDE